jgi:methionine aminotransferase
VQRAAPYAAPQALSVEIARVHQWVTYAVNGAIQRAYAEFVNKDPECRDLATFYQAKRDRFLELIDGSRFRPLPCRGTYFQMVDYSAITDERDADFALENLKVESELLDGDPGDTLAGRANRSICW